MALNTLVINFIQYLNFKKKDDNFKKDIFYIISNIFF